MVWVGRVVRDVLVECVHWRALEYEFGHPPARSICTLTALSPPPAWGGRGQRAQHEFVLPVDIVLCPPSDSPSRLYLPIGDADDSAG
jgi:hypothetical protein